MRPPDEENTPLHLAAGRNDDQQDIISFLVELGSDVFAKNHKGQTPLDVAMARGEKDSTGAQVPNTQLITYLKNVMRSTSEVLALSQIIETNPSDFILENSAPHLPSSASRPLADSDRMDSPSQRRGTIRI